MSIFNGLIIRLCTLVATYGDTINRLNIRNENHLHNVQLNLGLIFLYPLGTYTYYLPTPSKEANSRIYLKRNNVLYKVKPCFLVSITFLRFFAKILSIFFSLKIMYNRKYLRFMCRYILYMYVFYFLRARRKKIFSVIFAFHSSLSMCSSFVRYTS